MKKITGLICLLLVLAMTILAFSACGNATDTPTGEKESKSETQKGSSGSEPGDDETETTEERLKPNISDGSKFMYVDVADRDMFLPRSGIIWDEQKYTPDYDSTSTHHATSFLRN